jgi:hypothetical integral membrane protein (TIGR02206 family)
MPPLEGQPTFQHFGTQHLIVILLTIVLPFVLAGVRLAHQIARRRAEIVYAISAILILNYVVYLIFTRSFGELTWSQMLPMQMCDWAMVVVMVALWSCNHRWFEVAYFWGIGGTLQAVLTPNLHVGFPSIRFFNFFIAHSGIIIGVLFLMLVRPAASLSDVGRARLCVVGALFRDGDDRRPLHRRELRLSPAQTGGVHVAQLSVGFAPTLPAADARPGAVVLRGFFTRRSRSRI